MYYDYTYTNFRPKSLEKIELVNDIIRAYQQQDLTLTLRQLYYQMVAMDHIQNNKKEYDNLGRLIGSARMSGLVSWEAIVDRTRSIDEPAVWSNPASVLQSALHSYNTDLWKTQPIRLEVWVEKEALAQVMERACEEYNVPFMACRGYMSLSAIHETVLRFIDHINNGQQVIIVHLGDHDPSGIDMSRDNFDRIKDMLEYHFGSRTTEKNFDLLRIALNYDQVQVYNPPPNFTKMSDSRAGGYIAEYGKNSWELDALRPDILISLVQEIIQDNIRDNDAWQEALAYRQQGRGFLSQAIAASKKITGDKS